MSGRRNRSGRLFPLLDMAQTVYHKMSTFQEIDVKGVSALGMITVVVGEAEAENPSMQKKSCAGRMPHINITLPQWRYMGKKAGKK